MNRRSIRIIIVAALLSAIGIALDVQAAEKKGLTLDDCFAMALIQSESLSITEKQIAIAEAHYTQTLGVLFPHLTGKATELVQDSSQSGANGNPFIRRSTFQTSINLTQPLFQGFREFASIRMSKAERSKNALEFERASELLLLDVAGAFYTLLEMERRTAIYASMNVTLASRLKELRDRTSIGKSRQSEVLSVESQKAAIEGNLAAAKGLADVAREMLSFLTGQKISGVLVERTALFHRRVKDVDESLPDPDRADIEAAQKAVEMAKAKLTLEKGARLPSADLSANYYPHRDGTYNDVKWDMLFTVSVPIFSGGISKGRIAEAKAGVVQASLAKQQKEREAVLEREKARKSLAASLAEEGAMKRAEAKAGENYRAQSADYSLGLVSNLDVLQALRDWQTLLLEVNRAHFQVAMDKVKLMVAEGSLPQGRTGPPIK